MCSVEELRNVAYLQLLSMKWCVAVCTVTVFSTARLLTAAVSLCKFMCCWFKNSLEKYLEGPGKLWNLG